VRIERGALRYIQFTAVAISRLVRLGHSQSLDSSIFRHLRYFCILLYFHFISTLTRSKHYNGKSQDSTEDLEDQG